MRGEERRGIILEGGVGYILHIQNTVRSMWYPLGGVFFFFFLISGTKLHDRMN